MEIRKYSNFNWNLTLVVNFRDRVMCLKMWKMFKQWILFNFGILLETFRNWGTEEYPCLFFLISGKYTFHMISLKNAKPYWNIISLRLRAPPVIRCQDYLACHYLYCNDIVFTQYWVSLNFSLYSLFWLSWMSNSSHKRRPFQEINF